MKRIIAILLLCSLFLLAFVACKKHECTFDEAWMYDTESHWHAATCEHEDKKGDLAKHSFNDGVCVCGFKNNIIGFMNAINDTNPSKARLELEEDVMYDDIVLNGLYQVSYKADGTASVIYEIDQFDLTFTSENPIITVPGTLTVNADGTITGDNGLNRGVHIAILLDIDLANSALEFKVEGDNRISFKVSAADTAAVLGVAIDSDVTVGIEVVNGKVATMYISYANTTITAIYS